MRTNNLNVASLTTIVAPKDLKEVFPQTPESADFVVASRNSIKAILDGRDRRLLVVVGPCSIHDPAAAREYAERLGALRRELADTLFIVMRVYFEKPRTTVGWKGLINDPDLNDTCEISKGLGIARKLLCDLNAYEVPVAGEMLDTVTPEYLADLISWGAIGARTVESQTHREMASGLSFPVGFKNATDGNLQIALDAMQAAGNSHSFLGVNAEGRTSIVRTLGNGHVHVVLRGGRTGPNYSAEAIAETSERLRAANLSPAIMVDCSHANSAKDHNRQEAVLQDVVDQVCGGAEAIRGVMIESNLQSGSQKIPEDPADLKYGVSITDKCVDWETTARMLREAADRLGKANS